VKASEVNSFNLDTNLKERDEKIENLRTRSKRQNIYLVLKIIPPIGPSLLDTPLLLNDSVFNHGAKHTERHRDSMIVITVHTNTALELRNRLSNNLESIIQLHSINPEFR
jgi:hypothetical protein